MNQANHRFHDLFAQLGLANDTAGIAGFLTAHRPLPADVLLNEAPFWTAAQRAFLVEEITTDADWAELIDELDSALR